MVSLTSLGTQTLTPPSASTMLLEAVEVDHHEVVDPDVRELLDGLDRAGRAADGVRRVEHAQAARVGALAVLAVAGRGARTIASRGRLTPYASFRSPEMCSRIVVSDRPGVSPPMWPVWPSRVSEPSSRMLSGLLRGLLLHRGGAVGAQRVGDVDAGDVVVQVPVDEEAAGQHDDQDHGQREGHGLDDAVLGGTRSRCRGVDSDKGRSSVRVR